MPPVKMRGDGRKAKNPRKTLLRLLGYMKKYTLILIVVMVCIVVNSVAQTRGSENVGVLVDAYILPMVKSGSTDFGPLALYLAKIAGIFLLGITMAFVLAVLMLIRNVYMNAAVGVFKVQSVVIGTQMSIGLLVKGAG